MDAKTIKGLTRRQFIRLSAALAAGTAVGLPPLALAQVADKEKAGLPVVVIGSGLGGLTAAAYLAGQGFPVTVLETHDRPGGYATSFSRAAGKFEFEVSLHTTTGPLMQRILDEVKAVRPLELPRLPELAVLKTAKGEIKLPQADPQAFIKALADVFPMDEPGIRGFIEDILKIAVEVEKPFDIDSFIQKSLFPFTHSAMWNVRNLTLSEMLAPYDISPECRAVLCSWCGYYGLPPSLLSGFYYAVATGQMIRHGVNYVKPRSQALSWLLSDTIEAHGGQVLVNRAAKAIETKSGRVDAVVDATGQSHPARAVISNAALANTLAMLPNEVVPKDYARQTAEYPDSISSFIVWLGLNTSLSGKLSGYEYFLGADKDPEAAYLAALECDPHRAGLGVTLYDNAFPGYSKPGSGTLGLIILSGYGPWAKFAEDYKAGRKQAYLRQKNRITQILIDRAEKELIPGLRSMIEEVDSASPLTNIRYTANPKGAIYGFAQIRANAYMNRLSNKTPIPGLYLASAWGDPGGGYGGVMNAGRNCFQRLIKDWGFGVKK